MPVDLWEPFHTLSWAGQRSSTSTRPFVNKTVLSLLWSLPDQPQSMLNPQQGYWKRPLVNRHFTVIESWCHTAQTTGPGSPEQGWLGASCADRKQTPQWGPTTGLWPQIARRKVYQPPPHLLPRSCCRWGKSRGRWQVNHEENQLGWDFQNPVSKEQFCVLVEVSHIINMGPKSCVERKSPSPVMVVWPQGGLCWYLAEMIWDSSAF